MKCLLENGRHASAGNNICRRPNRDCIEFAAQSATKRDKARLGEVGQYPVTRFSELNFRNSASRALSAGAGPMIRLLLDVPDVEVVPIAGGGDLHSRLARGAIQGR